MGPDFLFIGAQRTASTWLFRNLRQHPDIWVPPNKSAVYFLPNFQRFRLKKALYYYREMFKTDDQYDRTYYLRYYSSLFPKDEWYLRLFPDRELLQTGEIAEDYAALSLEKVREIHSLLPDIKVIFILRKPWERAISHAKMVLKKQNVSAPKARDYMKDIKGRDSRLRSHYSRTLKIWKKFYSEERFFIGFYDDIEQDSAVFLSSLCRFLGVRYKDEYFGSSSAQKINTSEIVDAPQSVIMATMKLYKDEVEWLAEHVGGHALAWKKEIEEAGL